jgi:GTP-binding protein
MANFIKSAAELSQCPHDQRIEVCLVGRSNVGKSSLINALAKKKIALTSKTPGRTQLMNFYDFGSYRIVDLPGYGYAHVSKTTMVTLSNLIMNYLTKRPNIHLVLQICDANVITADDQRVANFLKNRFANYYVILNKIDKQNSNIYKNKLPEIANYLQVNSQQLILLSAIKKSNMGALTNLLKQLIVA